MPVDAALIVQGLRGRFIAFEGADGSGKSTQLRRLVEACGASGVPVCEVREPGGTDVGEQIRGVLLNKDNVGMSLRCEMLLYMASRAQLVESRIRPALREGKVVIADRFVSSTYAYQGAAGGLPDAEIEAVAKVACGTTLPELVLIFDVDERTAGRRAGLVTTGKGAKAAGGGMLFSDRIEDRGREFQRAVREGYLALAQRDPKRHVVIDARGGPDEVWGELLAALDARR